MFRVSTNLAYLIYIVYTIIDLNTLIKEIPMSYTFDELNIPSSIVEGLKKQGINSPTPIQELTIPAFKEGNDIIIHSHTGSGKTLAFLLPLIDKLDLEKRAVQAIILAPTHELVMQIHNQIKLLRQNTGLSITSCPLMGEVNIDNQIKKLKEKPLIVVGSCGRILDLISKRKLNTKEVQTIILDEADHLLENKQLNTIKKLLYTVEKDTQLCLCSATMTPETVEAIDNFMKSPATLSTSDITALNPNISHYYMMCEVRDKFDRLRKLLNSCGDTRTLIFVSQHTDSRALIEKLEYHNHKVVSISGNLSKEARQAALSAFRTGKSNILVSSDLSARGLDIPDITHVVHFDFPLTPNEYLHRAGRSARGTGSGISICLATTKNLGTIRVIDRTFDIKLEKIDLIDGRIKNLDTKLFLETAPKGKVKTAEQKKSKNKYPKGFKSDGGKKSKVSAKTKTDVQDNSDILNDHMDLTSGTLADALKLISDDKFGKNDE